MVHIVAYTYFLFDFGWQKLDIIFIHARIIREYSTIHAAGRELFDSREMSIRSTHTQFNTKNNWSGRTKKNVLFSVS